MVRFLKVAALALVTLAVFSAPSFMSDAQAALVKKGGSSGK